MEKKIRVLLKEIHMKFTPIDRTTWERNSHYDYYTNLLKCGYSVTVSLDITKLHQQIKEKGLKFYPAFVYCVSKQIAVTKEFRMGRTRKEIRDTTISFIRIIRSSMRMTIPSPMSGPDTRKTLKPSIKI